MLLKDYLPEMVSKTREFQQMLSTEEIELKLLNDETMNILNDLFVIDSSEVAVLHYEKMLNIPTKLSNSLEERKRQILILYNQIPPFNMAMLRRSITSLVLNENDFEMSFDKTTYSLNIILSLEVRHLYLVVYSLLDRLTPLNIKLNLKIDYNTWGDASVLLWKDVTNISWETLKTDPKYNIEVNKFMEEINA